MKVLCTLEKIIEILKAQGKKQKDLTDYLGLTKNTFTNWKAGHSESYKKLLPQIADFLNVSVDFLLGKENSPLSNENGLSESQREIIALFDSAPPELQAAALAVLRSAEQRSHTQDAE